MTNNNYGSLPTNLGIFNIECDEIMFYQYMPIKMAGLWFLKIPNRLKIFESLIDCAYNNITEEQYYKSYFYITAKHVYVTPEYWGNRPGYHTDGFGTDDINFIWSDCNPTIFNVGEFNISSDHTKSLSEFTEQAKSEHEITYPEKSLLMLDQYAVNKVAPVVIPRFRTFVKISVSKERYNLKGNTHNYLFDYDWEMVERGNHRNHTTKSN